MSHPLTVMRPPNGSLRRMGGVLATVLMLAACPPPPAPALQLPEPTSDPGPAAMRRLTDAQYRATIAAVFGDDIAIPWRLEPDLRTSGLLEVGAATVSVTATGLEEYEAAALGIAAQVLDADHRENQVACTPVTSTDADDDCASSFLADVGPLLFRRALTDAELDARVALAASSAESLQDFWQGLEIALASFLIAPDFLFRVEQVNSDGTLTAESLASRMSFLLWNVGPDPLLLSDAISGALLDPAVRADHVDRMLTDDRALDGIEALFADLYYLDELTNVRKDLTLFPAFDDTLMVSARTQTLATITDHLLLEERDYRELFTSRDTQLNRALGLIYQVPVTSSDGFEPHTFTADSPRAGILSHASLLSLWAHPGRTSATLRGKFIREVLLCNIVPPPPPDVDFSTVEASSEDLPTARDRLELHQNSPACVGCHELIDPIGLGLEQFDAIGMYRTEENGAVIDPSGELDGMNFIDAVDLGTALSEHPDLIGCFVDATWRRTVARDAVEGEMPLLEWLDERFANDQYTIGELLRAITTSAAFARSSGALEVEP